MREDWYDDIDIDRRDSNGNYYSPYERADSSNCNAHDGYINPPSLTKEQVYQNQLQELTFDLKRKQDELGRFSKYVKEAEKEVNGNLDYVYPLENIK